MHLEVGDRLRVPILCYQEIFFVETTQRAAVLSAHHYVENDNPRVCFEDLPTVVTRCRGLAVERGGLKTRQPDEKPQPVGRAKVVQHRGSLRLNLRRL